ncbi:MAG: isochorismatase family protein [Nitrososphaerota archaeon]|nr:isochorismatase family protein [Nitrososphaerota archaeon]
MAAVLIVIDFQDRLARRILGIEEILKNSVKLVRAFRILEMPIILTEQIKLGETVKEIRDHADVEPIVKSSFSCAKCPEFMYELERLNPEKCILIGIEAHICILQTAIDLREHGHEVHVAVDCIGSRRMVDKEVAVQRMIMKGVTPTTHETTIYELLQTAQHPKFKQILEIIKS